MKAPLHKLLRHLLETIDARRQAATDARFHTALNWKAVSRPPVVLTYPLPAQACFQPYPHREVFEDPEKMLFNELTRAFDASIALRRDIGDDLPLTVRANFGTVLVASMFGASVHQTNDDPPWVEHRDNESSSLEAIADTDPLDFARGWIPRAVRTMQAYHELLGEFPQLKSTIRIVLPDLQGPLDNLELVRGSQALLELASEPEGVARALETLATAQIRLARHFQQWTSEPANHRIHQHGVMLKGNILLRDDCSVMISAARYREQIAPHDERVMRELGGGAIHSCGKVGHLLDEWLALPSLRSLDLGQPELNDQEAIYAKAAAKQVPLIRLAVTEAEVLSGGAWRRFPTGAVLVCRAEDFESARRIGRGLWARESTEDAY